MLRNLNSKHRLVEIFLELVKIDGVSRYELDVRNYLVEFLENLDFEPIIDDAAEQVGGNTGNLIIEIGHGGDFVVLSHMDTAASTKMIQPKVLSDRITSDGNTILGADNRAGIAAIIYSLEWFIKNKKKIKDCVICFTICEENNIEGGKYLSLPPQIKNGYVIDSSLRPGKFIHRTYGAKGLKINITGKAAHSGLHPEDGISAIYTAALAIAKLKLGRVSETTTANLGIIQGGEAINVIPEKVEIVGEIRSQRVADVDLLAKNFEQHFKNACKTTGAMLNFSSQWDFTPYYVREDSLVFQNTCNIMKKIGLTPEPRLSAGGSDANALNEKGIQTVNIGIGAQNPHSHEEFILLEDLANAANIVYEILRGE
ncbi:MAG: M20/M25/M40 family metallo-hydrolase [Candidatus Marinimicrobia bacterium]|nr:M20/M25/M40 family metallo-hydrolase [Candidatus Neomarinimicrobiota bacterium]